MQFSLVVTTGNAAPWIERCIQSIAEQQTRWQWQCLIIDDASNDGTEADHPFGAEIHSGPGDS